MARVFISHSKDDEKGRIFFDKLFGSVEHQAYWYGWEGPKPPHARTLVEAIKASESMFVVLSPQMDQPFTRTWVGYEVGVAAALGKNVWVFEPKDEPVMVPVPYVTGFIQYPEKLNTKKVFPYMTIIEAAGKTIPKDPQPEIPPLFFSTFCPEERCKAPYALFVYGNSFHCPVCLSRLKIEQKSAASSA